MFFDGIQYLGEILLIQLIPTRRIVIVDRMTIPTTWLDIPFLNDRQWITGTTDKMTWI